MSQSKPEFDPDTAGFDEERWAMETSLIALVVLLRLLGVSRGEWSKVALKQLAWRCQTIKICRRIYG